MYDNPVIITYDPMYESKYENVFDFDGIYLYECKFLPLCSVNDVRAYS